MTELFCQLAAPRYRPTGLAFWGLLLGIASAGCDRADDVATKFPKRPIKVIVPFASGGGSDNFGRIIQSAIDEQKLLPQKLVIINVPGAGGTIGSRRVKNARPDGYTILLLHEGILTAKHSGQAAYGPEAFEAIVGSGKASQVIAVADDSKFRNLRDVLNDAAARPNEIVYAANIGAPSHFAGLMLEQQKPRAEFRYAQYGGGAKRFAAIKGGHVDISSFSLAEYAQFQSSGLRALAVLARDRHPDFPDLPSATEEGFDVVSENVQYWWAPKGTAPDKLQVVADAIEAAMNTPGVIEKLGAMQIDPVVLRGEDLVADIQRRDDSIAAVSQRKIQSLPNFPMIMLLITVALGIAVCIRRPIEREQPEQSTRRQSIWSAAAVAIATVVYIAALQLGIVPFVIGTAFYVILVGAWIAAQSNSIGTKGLSRTVPLLLVLAVSLSVGIHFVFTNVLVVDLP